MLQELGVKGKDGIEKMEFTEKRYTPYNDKMVYIIRDNQGNVATGSSREEALRKLQNNNMQLRGMSPVV